MMPPPAGDASLLIGRPLDSFQMNWSGWKLTSPPPSRGALFIQKSSLFPGCGSAGYLPKSLKARKQGGGLLL